MATIAFWKSSSNYREVFSGSLYNDSFKGQLCKKKKDANTVMSYRRRNAGDAILKAPH